MEESNYRGADHSGIVAPQEEEEEGKKKKKK